MDPNLIAAAAAVVLAALSFLLDLFRFLVSKDYEAKQRFIIIVVDIFLLGVLGYLVTQLAIRMAITVPGSSSDLVIRAATFSMVIGFLLGVFWNSVVAPAVRRLVTRNISTEK